MSYHCGASGCCFAAMNYYDYGHRFMGEPTMIHPQAIGAAEAAAGEVVLRLHPTVEADERRRQVIDYLKHLIGTSFGCEVVAFGSVPLKTYLPDGDIDVTILVNTPVDSRFMIDICNVLHDQNADPKFLPRDFEFVDAEVKLIKCTIGNILVDISFNQTGGVSKLCFLEMVDRQIGRNHLFKRSIVLIKAWCYHESQILGGHYGLMTTYALEILVLYIFNIFHKSLHGPLEALYRFLEYFSKFEWDKYCLTLNGPVELSSLHSLTVEPAAINDELLLNKELLEGSLDRLLVVPDGFEGWDTNFRRKHLNIIDPLKSSNNLGRSVSEGNFHSIRRAFSVGAQKLGQILKLPSEIIPDEIYRLFGNTFTSHGRGERLDLCNSVMSRSLVHPENAPTEAVSGLKIPCVNEDGNTSPNHLLELSDKEWQVKTNAHDPSIRYFPGDVKEILCAKSSDDFYKKVSSGHDCASVEDLNHAKSLLQQQQYISTSSTCTNTLDVSSSCPIEESYWSDADKIKPLFPPFSPSDLLDLSGDLDSYLGCLRNFQYHLEYLFNNLLQVAQEASLAGILDDDSLRAPIMQFSSYTDARSPRPYLASSTDAEKRNLSLVYQSRRAGYVPHQNVPLPSRADILCLPSVADSEIYGVSWLYNMEDISMTHKTDMSVPHMNVSLSFDTSFDRLMMSPYLYVNGGTTKTVGTGTYIPRKTSEYYKGYMAYGRSRRQRQPYRIYSSNENTAVVKSSKSMNLVLKAGFVSLENHTSTDCGTKQVETTPTLELQSSRERPENDSGETQAHPHYYGGNGQENIPVSKTCEPSPTSSNGCDEIKAQQENNILFGIFGSFPLELNSSQFIQEFPPLPATKGPREGLSSLPDSKRSIEASANLPGSKRHVEDPAAQNRPEELYRLRDDADFPPLQAVTTREFFAR